MIRHSQSWFSGLATLLIAAAWMVASANFVASAEPAEIQAPPTVLIHDHAGFQMRAKLTRSKEILEALLRRDFDSVSRAARELKRISEATKWPRRGDQQYERYNDQFRQQCSQLDSLANELNHEGVEFVYLNMISTCVGCHDHIRDFRRDADSPQAGTIEVTTPRQRLRNPH